MLEVKRINTFYGQFHAIRDASFVVEQGEFFLIVGPTDMERALC